jgi:formamidopyrimidine-DNA glycosylase
MPELPEVETIRRSLEPRLAGRRIEEVRVRERRLREPVPAARLRRLARGRRIVGLARRAKYLEILLDGDLCLLVHLGMSGRLQLRRRGEPFEPHVHVVFALEGGLDLRFRDPRRFGLVDFVPARARAADRRLRDLGPEPLSGECTADYLFERSRGLRRPVKNFLMDARHVAGVGNIYACEALFRAGIHPRRAAGRIGRASWARIAASLTEVLGAAILQGGTTINDFEDGDGNEGWFQVSLAVYGRAGEPCPCCRRPVRARVLAGRSTFFCSRCQR